MWPGPGPRPTPSLPGAGTTGDAAFPHQHLLIDRSVQGVNIGVVLIQSAHGGRQAVQIERMTGSEFKQIKMGDAMEFIKELCQLA